MKFFQWILFIFVSGCAVLGDPPLEVPPEFNQPVYLDVDDSYRAFQATLSTYDVGDLQNFHSQHTLPYLVEEAFKEMFGEVRMVKEGPKIDAGITNAPAVFEVKFLDLANDIYNEADNYRAVATLAVAMKSPSSGTVFWQKAFRANGYVRVDPQDSIPIGPQDAVVNAIRDAVDQMQQAIINAPQVRNQMKYYMAYDAQRRQQTQDSGQIDIPAPSEER